MYQRQGAAETLPAAGSIARAKVVNGGLRSGNSSLPFPPTKMEQFDLGFDFEHDLSSEVGQPAEAPQSMPPNARKNYRQVSPPLRHAVIPLISESRCACYSPLISKSSNSFQLSLMLNADSLQALAAWTLHERK